MIKKRSRAHERGFFFCDKDFYNLYKKSSLKCNIKSIVRVTSIIHLKSHFIMRYLYTVISIINNRKILIMLAGLLLYAGSYAQNYNEQCRANVYSRDEFNDLPWVGNNAWLPQYLDSIGYTGNTFNYENAMYRVPVYLWIFKKDNPSKRKTVKKRRIKKYITNLNYFYTQNNTGILFYLQGYKTIYKSRRVKLGYYLECPWISRKYRSKGAVNVYITNRIIKILPGSRDNVRGTYNKFVKSVFIQKNASSSTLSHEVGHYFGLLHPHENWDKGKRRAEAVSRTRTFDRFLKSGRICEVNGDGLCDTPAEPNLQRYSTIDCKFYAKHLKDPWGDTYNPAVNNIMSYTKNRDCRDNFTKGQIAVMLKTASKNRFSEAWTAKKGANPQYKFDASEPDNTRKMATKLKLNVPYYFTFHNIFSPGNSSKTDKTDWIKFTLSSHTKITITTQKGQNTPPNLHLALFNNKNESLAETNDATPFPAITKELESATYWLKISNTKDTRELCDYQLKIEK